MQLPWGQAAPGHVEDHHLQNRGASDAQVSSMHQARQRATCSCGSQSHSRRRSLSQVTPAGPGPSVSQDSHSGPWLLASLHMQSFALWCQTWLYPLVCSHTELTRRPPPPQQEPSPHSHLTHLHPSTPMVLMGDGTRPLCVYVCCARVVHVNSVYTSPARHQLVRNSSLTPW